ncbi:MAG: hypothetical protein LBT46_02050 [Planctomycetaceae bacterium]|jgi:hypothetical protein|nr:hypothetical protein [Planctomycetaceae bacterium]
MRSITTVISFLVVLALYFLYGWVLVPAVLPIKQITRSAPVSGGETAQREAVEPFLPVLPEDGWECDAKHELHFLQFDTVVVLFGHDQIDGQNKRLLKLEPCTVMILPDTNDHLTEESLRAWQRQTIVLRTAQYAEIEFDNEFDAMKLPLPKVVAGRLYGKVSISSGMKEEGPQDDLLLEAENVAVTDTESVTKIETLKDVRFHLGYHSGEGTNLSLELTAKETGDKAVKSVSKELSSVIFQRLKTLRLVFPEDEKAPCQMTGGVAVPDSPVTLLDVRCQRHFGFIWNSSESSWQAGFNGNVDITRTNPDKTVDRLTADEVILTLQNKTAQDTTFQDKAASKSAAGQTLPYGNFGAMEPVKFVARGKKDVQPPQPARFALKHGSDVQLIGDEIFIDLRKKMVKLSTFDQKTEKGASKEIEMIISSLYSIKSNNTVEYTFGDNGTFGAFNSVGKGSMTGKTGSGVNSKNVRLDWNEMAMAPHPLVKEQLVVKLGKGISGAMDGFGTLTADEAEICCNMEQKPASSNYSNNNNNSNNKNKTSQPFASNGASSEVVPDHIIVKNNVRFANDAGTCDVKRLDIYFTNVSQDGKVTQSRWTPQAMFLPPPQCGIQGLPLQAIELVQYQQQSGEQKWGVLQPLPLYQPAQAPAPIAPVVGSSTVPVQRVTKNPLSSQNLLGLQSKQGTKFAVSGDLMKMQVRNQNGQATAEIVALEGNVKADEAALPQDKASAFTLRGDAATVWEPDGLNTAVKITCRTNSPDAFIKGRGVEIWSKELNLTRADNNCWSPSSGRLIADTSNLPSNLTAANNVPKGNVPQTSSSESTASRLVVEWNKNMQFDGKVMRFFGQTDKTGNRVRVLYQTQSLWCDTMEIYLNRQVRFFDDTSKVPPKAEMIQCAKNVFVRNLERDASGKQKSISTAEAELLRYYLDRNYLVAEGPGRMSSTFAGKTPAQDTAGLARAASSENALSHLSVWFQDTLQGVLLGSGKNIDLNGRVEVAYFPAAGWDDTIAHENFAAARKTGCTLECEKMKITEMPNPADTAQTTMELTAEDDAVIDGYGVFGKAQLIKFSQLKNTVRFEKSVKVKTNRTGQSGDYSAESAEYNIATGSVNNVGMQNLTIAN